MKKIAALMLVGALMLMSACSSLVASEDKRAYAFGLL